MDDRPCFSSVPPFSSVRRVPRVGCTDPNGFETTRRPWPRRGQEEVKVDLTRKSLSAGATHDGAVALLAAGRALGGSSSRTEDIA
jgi:hypothetical protein